METHIGDMETSFTQLQTLALQTASEAHSTSLRDSNPACRVHHVQDEIRAALKLAQERIDWYTRDATDALKIVKKPATRKKKVEACTCIYICNCHPLYPMVLLDRSQAMTRKSSMLKSRMIELGLYILQMYARKMLTYSLCHYGMFHVAACKVEGYANGSISHEAGHELHLDSAVGAVI